jgi:hypothetical protein
MTKLSGEDPKRPNAVHKYYRYGHENSSHNMCSEVHAHARSALAPP